MASCKRSQASALLADLDTAPDECADGVNRASGAPCSSRPVVLAIMDFVKKKGVAVPAKGDAVPAKGDAVPAKADAVPAKADHCDPILPTAASAEAAAVRAAAALVGCESESCVLQHPAFLEAAPKSAVAADLELRFKAPGPRNTTELLSNFNIDDTLRKWARHFDNFFPCPFAMMDFDATREPFAVIDLGAVLQGRVECDLGPGVGLVRRPARRFGCVVNTDTSRGSGKHWVAVFVDCSSAEGAWTVEYFNSVGQPPPKAMVKWMERSRARLAACRQEAASGETPWRPGPVEAVPVTRIDHQQSQTECGLYSLYYIRRRLEGTPYSFFEETVVPDAAMTEFRRHVFRSK